MVALAREIRNELPSDGNGIPRPKRKQGSIKRHDQWWPLSCNIQANGDHT